jgi:hypothetical protein
MQKIKKWTLWRGRPSPKRKTKPHMEQEPDMWEHRPLQDLKPSLQRERVRGEEGNLYDCVGRE